MVIPIHNANAATPAAGAVSASTSLPYPKKSVGKVGVMPVNQITNFSYPDTSSPCYALRLGKPVVGGVGPNNDIVYRDQTPPVDLSLQIHQTLPIVAPGSTMVFSLDDFGCELSINKLPMSTLARQVGPRARRADRG